MGPNGHEVILGMFPGQLIPKSKPSFSLQNGRWCLWLLEFKDVVSPYRYACTRWTRTTVPRKTRTSGSCGTSVFESLPASICGTFPSAFPAQKRGFKNVVPNGSKGTEWPWDHSKYVSWAPKCRSLNHPCLYPYGCWCLFVLECK